ncbi:MAG TPA: acetylornithine deacetylase [Alphaproteobacteria bacterium]
MAGPSVSPYQMIERLVSFDTTSRGSNLDLIGFVADYLAGYGIKATRLLDDAGAKANLFATIGPERDGGVVLSGHTDVVPVDDQDWDSDPFTVVRRGGRLYGRGTADMKSFSAVVLALVPELIARGPKRPVHLALSYDEEVGCLGAPRLVELLRAASFAPAAVIVGEPTGMKVVNRHKGVYRFKTSVTGLEAHSAHTDRGVSAILVAGRLIERLDRLARAARAAAEPGSGFDPPYHTLHVGLVEGGTAVNILARHCAFDWELRLLPGGDAARDFLDPFEAFVTAEVLPEMHAVSSRCAVATAPVVGVEGLAPVADNPAEALARTLAGDNAPAGAISFGTEAGLFQRGGTPTVVCGPGSILQAHKANEYIEVAQVEACIAFMRRLIAWACD